MLLLVIGLLAWRVRRGLVNNETTTADRDIYDEVEGHSPQSNQRDSPLDQRDLTRDQSDLQRDQRDWSGEQHDLPRDQDVPDYLELLNTSPLKEQSCAVRGLEYQSLQDRNNHSVYQNLGFNFGNNNQEDEVYYEIGNSLCKRSR